jgi:hypothetical protein
MLARSNALPNVYRCQAAVNREYYRALNKLLDLRKPPKAPRKTASKTPEIAETNPDISLETQQSQAPEPGQPGQPEEQRHREETTGAERTTADRHPQLATLLSLVAALMLFAVYTTWKGNHSSLRTDTASKKSESAETNPAISLERKELPSIAKEIAPDDATRWHKGTPGFVLASASKTTRRHHAVTCKEPSPSRHHSWRP